MAAPTDIRLLGAGDLAGFDAMLDLFGTAFDDPENYGSARPSPDYVRRLLQRDTFVAILAMAGDRVVGALAAYELHKFEQARSELYIYDLAVAEDHRRQGIATSLIDALKQIAVERGAHVIFVQADHGDEPAIALYTKLGTREDVMHFDIPPSP
jgi:aminoglycoside 3-N-acetyltransferase I